MNKGRENTLGHSVYAGVEPPESPGSQSREAQDAQASRDIRAQPGLLLALSSREQGRALKAMQRDHERWLQTATIEQQRWAQQRQQPFDLYAACR